MIEPELTNPYDTSGADKLGTLAPPSQRDEISTLPIPTKCPIMLNRSRPTTQQKRPTQDNKALNQNSMNEMCHTSHHEHAIRVGNNTQYPIDNRVTKQNVQKEKEMNQKQTKIRQLERMKREQEAIRKMFHNSRFKHLL